MMRELLAWLTPSNAPVLIAIASAVSAFAALVVMWATVVNVVINRRLARDNRALNKAGSEPRVVAYAIINPYVYGAIDFVIRNIGKGAARNVSYKIVSGGEDLDAKKVNLPRPNMGYTFLPQDEQVSTFMGMGWDLLAAPEIKPFEVEITYEDLKGSKHSGRYKIDAAQFGGLHRVGKPPEQEIVDHLKTIASVLEGWSHRRLQVETMSVTERREHDQQVMQAMEDRRARRSGEAPPAGDQAA
jgi:hypothetical protein